MADPPPTATVALAYDLVIFDLDGTLVDSFAFFARSQATGSRCIEMTAPCADEARLRGPERLRCRVPSDRAVVAASGFVEVAGGDGSCGNSRTHSVVWTALHGVAW